jgi:Fur family transcriptional regulator, ferric uptake regulator
VAEERAMKSLEEKEIFHSYLRRTGNKLTTQRDLILEVFLQSKGHLSAEEVYQKAKIGDPMLGFTTVYRTLKLLVDAGLAREEKFNDGHTRYEYDYKQQHHDHLICEKCGHVIEFFSEALEQAQDHVIEHYGFKASHHSLRIFGSCDACHKMQIKTI